MHAGHGSIKFTAQYMIVMYRFVLYLAVALTALADDTVNYEQCSTILNTQDHCCKMFLCNKTSIILEDVKQCKLMPRVPGSCDRALCFATKLGIETADGTVKMDKLQKYFEGKFSEYNDILEAVNHECYGDKYNLFGEPDECDLMKIMNCIKWQSVFRCPHFNDEETCNELKDIAAKCLELDF